MHEMKKALLIICLLSLPGWASVNVPLTIQELLYAGDPTGTTYSGPGGVARTNEPFCMGVPLADSAGVTDPQTLTLGGASAGQFRTLANLAFRQC